MSTSVDQRNKGQAYQVSNGPGTKDGVKEDFDGYFQAQGAYTAPMSSPSVPDLYMNYGYMSYPFQGDGAWSSGGDPMNFASGYGQMNNDYMSGNGMFGNFGGYGQALRWDFAGNDYSAWGPTSIAAGAQQGRKDRGPYEGYYGMGQMDVYGTGMNGEMERDEGMKVIDKGFQGMHIEGGEPKQDMVDHHHHHRGGGGGGDASAGVTVPSHGPQGGQVGSGGGSGPPPKKTWASIASQPAKPQAQMKPKAIPRAPVLPGKHNMDIGTWDGKGSGGKQGGQQQRQGWGAPRGGRSAPPAPYGSGGAGSGGGSASNSGGSSSTNGTGGSKGDSKEAPSNSAMLKKLQLTNNYNPKDFSLNPKGARYFIIKSYSEDDIHRSIKYSIWCSTEHGNKRLDTAFREREGKGAVYLFFSVNGSGHFCGMAQMMSPLDYSSSSNVWSQDKWKGQFEVKWIYVKDVPNSQLRHIRLENNENKPVTNSRDTQEVPPEKGRQVLKIMNSYRNTTSIFDDFEHYEKRQDDEKDREPRETRETREPREPRESRKPEKQSEKRSERNGGGRQN